MMRRTWRFAGRRLWCLLPALLALGCRDALSPGARLPRPTRNEVLVRLVVSPEENGETYVVHAVTKRGVAFEAPTAFQASLQLPDGVRFVEDASNSSGFLCAMNVVDGVLRVAGAAAQGDERGELFAARVTSADPTRLSHMALQVVEFRDRTGHDQRTALRVIAPLMEGGK